MQSFVNVWDKVVENLASSVTGVSYDLWVKSLTPVDFNGETATFSVPSFFHRNIVVSKYLEIIRKAMAEVIGFDVDIEIEIESETAPKAQKREERPGTSDAKARLESFIPTISINQEYTFDNFIVGNSNRFAHAACQAVAANPAGAYNPLFIHGGSGLGKTHLLYAIQNEIRKNFPRYKILYIKGEDFTNELIEGISQSKTMEFRNKYRSVDLLLVDDIQFIGGKDSTQEEFFHTFNTLYEAKKQIVLVSDRPPKEIQRLEDRLRGRFEWGLIADIQSPDYELRMAIIRKKAELMKLDIPDDVVEFIANRLKNNIRQLEGALKKTMAYYMLTGTPPTILTAQNAIRDILNENEPVSITIDRIITEVSRFYNLKADELKSKKRTAEVTLARQVAMYIIREVTQVSLPYIGEEFGGRDHSTVHHAISKIENQIRKNSAFKNNIQDLIRNVKEK